MSFSDTNKINGNTKHSDPITINPSASFRRRSASSSSNSSSGSGSSPDIPTPTSGPNVQHINIPSLSTSPILSFLGQSPIKSAPGTTGTFPFKRKYGAIPVYEEPEPEQEIPVAAHARRASTNVAAAAAGRFLHNQAIPERQHERGANTLRRLSLSSGFVRPQINSQSGRNQSPPPPPPNSAVSPTDSSQRKPVRSATMSADSRKPRRAPSPMGERILKGHFDGFN